MPSGALHRLLTVPTGAPGGQRVDRSDQERERHLQYRYQVRGTTHFQYICVSGSESVRNNILYKRFNFSFDSFRCNRMNYQLFVNTEKKRSYIYFCINFNDSDVEFIYLLLNWLTGSSQAFLPPESNKQYLSWNRRYCSPNAV